MELSCVSDEGRFGEEWEVGVGVPGWLVKHVLRTRAAAEMLHQR